MGVTMKLLIIERREKSSYCYAITSVEEEEDLPWCLNIWNFISEQKYPERATEKDKRMIRRLLTQFVIHEGELY